MKEARRDELMELQQQIAFEHADSLIGYELDILIDDQVDEGVYIGRSFADAPEIDSNVFVSAENLEIGSMVPVEIVRREDYDLIGVANTVEIID